MRFMTFKKTYFYSQYWHILLDVEDIGLLIVVINVREKIKKGKKRVFYPQNKKKRL